jgi:hypothetical protein
VLEFSTMPCERCPCPDICAGGIFCVLAHEPARHAHIRNVSAIKHKRGRLREEGSVSLRAESPAPAIGPPMLPSCCGG